MGKKGLNPADAARRAQKKKDIKKNKKQRQDQRDAVLAGANPQTLTKEIDQLYDEERATLDDAKARRLENARLKVEANKVKVIKYLNDHDKEALEAFNQWEAEHDTLRERRRLYYYPARPEDGVYPPPPPSITREEEDAQWEEEQLAKKKREDEEKAAAAAFAQDGFGLDDIPLPDDDDDSDDEGEEKQQGDGDGGEGAETTGQGGLGSGVAGAGDGDVAQSTSEGQDKGQGTTASIPGVVGSTEGSGKDKSESDGRMTAADAKAARQKTQEAAAAVAALLKPPMIVPRAPLVRPMPPRPAMRMFPGPMGIQQQAQQPHPGQQQQQQHGQQTKRIYALPGTGGKVAFGTSSQQRESGQDASISAEPQVKDRKKQLMAMRPSILNRKSAAAPQAKKPKVRPVGALIQKRPAVTTTPSTGKAQATKGQSKSAAKGSSSASLEDEYAKFMEDLNGLL
eukprot:m.186173 g.186173  ORF g.186173 m.186173 type:complete len:454 (-) comp14751_c0_seq1:1998-3359(-)